MPRPTPPRTTRAGTLHARRPTSPAPPADATTGTDTTPGAGAEVEVPPLPVRGPGTPAAATEDRPAPLAVLRMPTRVPAGRIESRRLDRGRLSASALVDALGWEPGTALDVIAHAGPVLALAPSARAGAWATSRPHVDAQRRIVVPNL